MTRWVRPGGRPGPGQGPLGVPAVRLRKRPIGRCTSAICPTTPRPKRFSCRSTPAAADSVVRVRLAPHMDADGRKRAFGFVTMASPEVAKTAADALRTADLRGRRLAVGSELGPSEGRAPSAPRRRRTLGRSAVRTFVREAAAGGRPTVQEAGPRKREAQANVRRRPGAAQKARRAGRPQDQLGPRRRRLRAEVGRSRPLTGRERVRSLTSLRRPIASRTDSPCVTSLDDLRQLWPRQLRDDKKQALDVRKVRAQEVAPCAGSTSRRTKKARSPRVERSSQGQSRTRARGGSGAQSSRAGTCERVLLRRSAPGRAVAMAWT